MSSAILLFAARMLVLLLLYIFLYLVVRALRRDLSAAGQRIRSGSPSPRRQRAAALSLELLDAGQTSLVPGETYPLRDPLLIGRAPSSDIALEDDWVSAQHVRLERRHGTWRAEDLGSTNGTRLNGQALTDAVTIRPGDELDLGRVKFRLVERS